MEDDTKLFFFLFVLTMWVCLLTTLYVFNVEILGLPFAYSTDEFFKCASKIFLLQEC